MKSHQSTTASLWRNLCNANEKIIMCNPCGQSDKADQEVDEDTCKTINGIFCCTPFIAMVGVKAAGVVLVSAAGVVATPFTLSIDAASCCNSPKDQNMESDVSVATAYQKL